MPVRQHALTVVAPIRDDRRRKLASTLEGIEREVIAALEKVKSLHFGRFVILTDPNAQGASGASAMPTSHASERVNGGSAAALGAASSTRERFKAPRLVFESNYDGELEDHLRELQRALAPFEDAIFGSWEGYESGGLVGFVAKNARKTATFYLGHPGLSVTQIHDDDALRKRLAGILDELVREGVTSSPRHSAVATRDAVLKRLGSAPPTPGTAPMLGAVDRGLPEQPRAKIEMVGILGGMGLTALASVPAALYTEYTEARDESPRVLVSEDDTRLDAIISHEDAVFQNGLTHHVPIRPGIFRKYALRLVLWTIEQARLRIAYEGELGGITSIHFARWVVLDDETLLFFSNYDGSWESYLSDFVDKAAKGLSAVWTNTKWFPETKAFFWKGADQEAIFKRWARTFQVRNQIWYSAYPNLSVDDILANAAIREGAVGTMNEDDARAWIARL